MIERTVGPSAAVPAGKPWGAPVPMIPEPLTVPALQSYVAHIVAERGFTTDLDRVFILLVEEVGELAEHVGTEGLVDLKALGDELADVVLYVADVANGFAVELAAALADHGARGRISVARPGEVALTDWQTALAAQAPGPAVSFRSLVESVGALARCVRKRWTGKPVPECAGALARAAGAVLELAGHYRIDLTRAIREKEVANAQRTWTF